MRFFDYFKSTGIESNHCLIYILLQLALNYGVSGVAGSNPAMPTIFPKPFQ